MKVKHWGQFPTKAPHGPDPEFERFEYWADQALKPPAKANEPAAFTPRFRAVPGFDRFVDLGPYQPGAPEAQQRDFRSTYEGARADGFGLPEIVWADDWGHSAPRPDMMDKVQYPRPFDTVTFHHTGTRNPEVVENLHRPGPVNEIMDIIRGTDYHTFGDVGYHFMIGEDGTIYQGRPLDFVGAHVLDQNDGNIGLAFLGDYGNRPLTSAQVSSARALSRMLADVYGIERYATHADLSDEKRNELRGAAAQIPEIAAGLRAPKPIGF